MAAIIDWQCNLSGLNTGTCHQSERGSGVVWNTSVITT